MDIHVYNNQIFRQTCDSNKSVLLLAVTVSRFQDELRKVVVVERLADVVCVTGSQVVEMEMA